MTDDTVTSFPMPGAREVVELQVGHYKLKNK